MNHQKSQALDAIDRNRELLCRVSDQLWEHPEVGFHEKYAAELYCDTLEALGFQVERNLAGIPTAFSGTYGNDGPVIGFLGEFDALPGFLTQQVLLRLSVENPGAGVGSRPWLWPQPAGCGVAGCGRCGEAVSSGQSSAGDGRVFRLSRRGGGLRQGLYGPERSVSTGGDRL